MNDELYDEIHNEASEAMAFERRQLPELVRYCLQTVAVDFKHLERAKAEHGRRQATMRRPGQHQAPQRQTGETVEGYRLALLS